MITDLYCIYASCAGDELKGTREHHLYCHDVITVIAGYLTHNPELSLSNLIEAGDVLGVRLMIESGTVAVNTSAAKTAIKCGRSDMLEYLLPAAKRLFFGELFNTAAGLGDMDTLMLLMRYADIDKYLAITCLAAITENKLNVLEYMLENHRNGIYYEDEDDWSPMAISVMAVCAVEKWNDDIIDLLIRHGAANELLVAVADYWSDDMMGDVRKVLFLIQCGADVNIGEGEPLRRAIYSDKKSIVAVLLKHGADPHNAVCAALERQDRKLFKRLLSLCDRERLRDDMPELLTDAADLALIKCLLDFDHDGADAAIRTDGVAREVLIGAAKRGQVNIIEFMTGYVDLFNYTDGIARAAMEGDQADPLRALHRAGHELPWYDMLLESIRECVFDVAKFIMDDVIGRAAALDWLDADHQEEAALLREYEP